MAETKKTHKSWGLEDEKLLIEVWADKLPELRGQRKNSHVYKEIAAIMGNIYSPEAIKIKLVNLTNRYRMEKQNIGSSGGSPSQWRLYSSVHKVLRMLTIHNLEKFTEDSIKEPPSQTPTLPSIIIEDNLSAPIFEADHPISSPDASVSSSLTRPAARKRKMCTKNKNDEEIFKRIDIIINENFKKMKQNDQRIIEIMEKRNGILERIANSCETVQCEILSFLHGNK